MKILMLSDVFFPRVNGVSTSIETFRTQLAARNVALSLIAPAYPEPAPAADWISRVPSRRVPFDPEDRLMSRGAAIAAGRTQLPTLIHIQTPFAAHYAGLALARWHRVPVIATYHTLFEEYLHHYLPLLPRRLTATLARSISRRQCNALDAVIVPSPEMRDRLRGYGVTAPLHVLPTGIPLARFSSGDGRRFRERHGIAAGHRLALFVGRIAHEKNIDFLINVAERCRDAAPELDWLIAGDGPALSHLRRLAAQLGLGTRVRFVGYLDRERELADCYAAADCFVFASKTETQGLVVLEAMAAGLPVVALPAMGVAGIVAGGRAVGALTPADDVDDFAQAVLTLAGDGELRRELGEAAQRHAGEWSDAAMAERLIDLYGELRFARGRRLQASAVATA
jgi:glycosyltransferase involved in cell wall biosynthesis